MAPQLTPLTHACGCLDPAVDPFGERRRLCTHLGSISLAESTHIVKFINCPSCLVRMDELQQTNPFHELKVSAGGPFFEVHISRFGPTLGEASRSWLPRMFAFPVNVEHIRLHPNWYQLNNDFPGLKDFNQAFRPLVDHLIDTRTWWDRNPNNEVVALREVAPGHYALLYGLGICCFNQATQA